MLQKTVINENKLAGVNLHGSNQLLRFPFQNQMRIRSGLFFISLATKIINPPNVPPAKAKRRTGRQGVPIILVVAGILALAFMGFTGPV